MSQSEHSIVSPRFAIKGGLLFITVTASTLLLTFKLMRNNKILSSALIEHLRKLSIEKPNNPIFIFLLKNNATLIRNIERSYIYDNIEKALISIIVLAFLLAILLLAYSIYKYHQDQKNGQNKERRSEYNSNVFIFGVGFFGAGAIFCAIALIPLFFKAPDKLSELLCNAITGENIHHNGLLEVLKNIIEHTFRDEKLVLDFKQSVKKYLIAFTFLNVILFAGFLITGIYYCHKYCRENDPDREKGPESQTNVVNVATVMYNTHSVQQH